MRKIIFVHLYNDRSGSPKVLSQVIHAVCQQDIPAEVLTSDHENGFLSDLPDVRKKIFYRRSENKVVTLFYYLFSQLYLFFFCLRYWHQDVTFYINTMMPFGASLAARFLNKPVIYHIHETSIRPALLKRFLRLMIKLTAGKIIFVSDYLRQAEGFEDRSQYVIYNSLGPNNMHRPVKMTDAKFNVLMICSMKAYKGVWEYLEIAKKLHESDSITFSLVLNAEPVEIDNFFKNSAIPSNVTLFPRQSNVNNFYGEASLLLNLSRPDQCVETFGLTVLEGMSYGLPVIVPPVGGPAEIVEDGREGFLISCYETEAIADRINELSSNSELYKITSKNAEIHAKKFNSENFGKEIVDAIYS
jgi:glycosyltransferase involved in cell wall biosynthesis